MSMTWSSHQGTPGGAVAGGVHRSGPVGSDVRVVRLGPEGVACVVVDCRPRGVTPSAREVESVARSLADARGRDDVPVALVTHAGLQYAGARLLCTLGDLVGCRAAAFTSDEQALAWLGECLGVSGLDDGAVRSVAGTVTTRPAT
jgi:hypothetical protein